MSSNLALSCLTIILSSLNVVSASTEKVIFDEVFRWVRYVITNIDFDGDPDQDADPGIFFYGIFTTAR